jgi:hypothetical protein
MKIKALLTVGTFMLLATTLAHAGPLTKASIPFQFNAGGKVLPAGQYDFSFDGQQGVVTVRGASDAALVKVLTRMAAGIHTTPADAHVVFDKVGETYKLSEIWIPEMDGFALNIEKGEHTHKMIDAPR